MEEGTRTDSNSNNRLSSDEKEEFKQVAATLANLLGVLTALVVTVMTSDAGHEFLTKHNILMNILTLGIVAFFLVQVLHTMLHQHISSSFFATLLLLVLGTAVSVLALSLISWTISLITLALWAIVFILIVLFKCQDLYKPIIDVVFGRIKKWIGSFKPQFSILTAVFEGIKKLMVSFKKWIFENYWLSLEYSV